MLTDILVSLLIFGESFVCKERFSPRLQMWLISPPVIVIFSGSYLLLSKVSLFLWFRWLFAKHHR